MSGEWDFIAWLRNSLKSHGPTTALTLGPGDDCAVVNDMVVASDMLMDQVHFDLQKTDPFLAGRKALAVNLSDLAAMAATPKAALISLALPNQGGNELAEQVMRGVLELAQEYGVAIAGGDTNFWEGPLVINVSILGTPHRKGNVLRSGAKVGDWICVTGNLGGSLSGHHLSFFPRVHEAQLLHERYGLNAMLDLSDGLATDLRFILSESKVGAILDAQAIPLSLKAQGSLERALTDGEDFELCFTLAPLAAQKLCIEQPFGLRVPITKIGEITDISNQLLWQDGTSITLKGFEHRPKKNS